MMSFVLAVFSALVLAPGSALAKKSAQNAVFSTQMYESGAVMEKIMSTKMVSICSKIEFLDNVLADHFWRLGVLG